MISRIELKNVGPLPDGEYKFGRRINAFTGDNGLGKTFLLDLIWFTFSNDWPAFANPAMTVGNMARSAHIDARATLSYGDTKASVRQGIHHTTRFLWDKWLDFDFSGDCHEVQCEDRPFERRGGADDWLKSSAFDLTSTRSREMELMLNKASEQLQNMLEKSVEKLRLGDAAYFVSHKREIRKIYAALARKLPPTDRCANL